MCASLFYARCPETMKQVLFMLYPLPENGRKFWLCCTPYVSIGKRNPNPSPYSVFLPIYFIAFDLQEIPPDYIHWDARSGQHRSHGLYPSLGEASTMPKLKTLTVDSFRKYDIVYFSRGQKLLYHSHTLSKNCEMLVVYVQYIWTELELYHRCSANGNGSLLNLNIAMNGLRWHSFSLRLKVCYNRFYSSHSAIFPLGLRLYSLLHFVVGVEICRNCETVLTKWRSTKSLECLWDNDSKWSFTWYCIYVNFIKITTPDRCNQEVRTATASYTFWSTYKILDGGALGLFEWLWLIS